MQYENKDVNVNAVEAEAAAEVLIGDNHLTKAELCAVAGLKQLYGISVSRNNVAVSMLEHKEPNNYDPKTEADPGRATFTYHFHTYDATLPSNKPAELEGQVIVKLVQGPEPYAALIPEGRILLRERDKSPTAKFHHLVEPIRRTIPKPA